VAVPEGLRVIRRHGHVTELRGQDSVAARRRRGAFFTPAGVAQFIVSWCLRSPRDRLLDPAAGEAVFLAAAGDRLAELGASPGAEQLQGCEIHQDSAQHAAGLLAGAGVPAQIAVGDFFARPAGGSFDAVVGNPPFIRYQGFTGETRARARELCRQHGVALSGLSSSWAPFLVHAAASLAPTGRLGFVLPGELLTRNYAAAIREFVLRRFAQVHVVVFDQRVFPGVLEEVVILLAEGSGGCRGISVHRVRDLSQLRALVPERATGGGYWRPPAPGVRWSAALLDAPARDAFDRAAATMTRLEVWGRPKLGMVTGGNRFFAMSGAAVRAARLRDDEVQPIVPPGSTHLRRLEFDREDWSRLVAAGSAAYLFRPSGGRLSSGARRLIRHGERTGVADAYKCRVRDPWWTVPDLAPPDLFVTYMNHETVQLATNSAGVRCLNSVHGLDLVVEPGLGRELLPLAALNSVTMLSAELVGRTFGGGMLQVLPREAAALLVPGPDLVARAADRLRAVKPQVRSLLAVAAPADAARLVDEVLLAAGAPVTEADLEVLRAARRRLYEARAARTQPARRTVREPA
jgi:tRNA1(Val) A37 N6-methylase TrmN6